MVKGLLFVFLENFEIL